MIYFEIVAAFCILWYIQDTRGRVIDLEKIRKSEGSPDRRIQTLEREVRELKILVRDQHLAQLKLDSKVSEAYRKVLLEECTRHTQRGVVSE